MSMQLQWLASPSTSCFHAVIAMWAGDALADARLADAIDAPGHALLKELSNHQLPVERVLNRLAAYSAEIQSNRELAQLALKKTIAAAAVTERLVHSLAGRITDLENAIGSVYPKMGEELPLRGGPLREQWESRGPGLMKSIARLTDERLLVENAQVILVHPALGGGGGAQICNNSVRFEAVLVNPEPQLPEIVRLGWMLAQLNTDLPIFGEHIHPDRIDAIAALALVVPTLSAAEQVELARCDLPTIELALKTWRVPWPAGPTAAKRMEASELADVLLNAWETYQEMRPPWEVALRAIDVSLA
jgi:hypothetical protein